MAEIQFDLLLQDDEILSAARAAQAAHYVQGDIPEHVDRTIAPVMALLIAAGVAALAEFVMDLWDRLQGGVVIDVSTGTPQIRRERALPANYILIHTKDGKVEIDTKDTPKGRIQQLIESVISGVLKTTDQVSTAATEAGAKATTPASV
jgi:hypothetical protein